MHYNPFMDGEGTCLRFWTDIMNNTGRRREMYKEKKKKAGSKKKKRSCHADH